MPRLPVVQWLVPCLILLSSSGCDLNVDAGDPIVEPPPEVTKFAGMVWLNDTPDGSSGRAIFITPQYDAAEVLGITPDGTCSEGAHSFEINDRSQVLPDGLSSVGPEVTISIGGDAPAMAKTEGAAGEPRLYYRFDQKSTRLTGAMARVSWTGDSTGYGIPDAFDGDLVAMPEAPTTSYESIQAIAGEDLKLDWSGTAGDMMIIAFSSSTDDTLPSFSCVVRDTGTTTIDARVIDQLGPEYDRLELDRVSFRKVPWLTRDDEHYGLFGIGLRQTVVELSYQPKRMFVTSKEFSSDLMTEGGGTSGLDGADRLCNAAAGSASLGGTWKAFLADDATNGLDRIEDVGPWYLLNGRKVFEDKAGLTDDPLGGPVNVDETGAPVTASWVWTGMGVNAVTRNGDTCTSWTGTGYSGVVGSAGSSDYTWLTYTNPQCTNTARLYCLEQ